MPMFEGVLDMNNSVVNKLINKYSYADINREDIARYMENACDVLDVEKYLTEKIEEDINRRMSDKDCKFQIIKQYFDKFDYKATDLDKKVNYMIDFFEKYHVWFYDDEVMAYVRDIPFFESFLANYHANHLRITELTYTPPFVQLYSAYKKSIGIVSRKKPKGEEKVDIEDNITLYLRDLNQEPKLPREEEVYLCHRVKAGDKEAFDIMVKRNLPLVISCVKKLNVPRKYYADLISEGNLALMNAVLNFDINRGYHFSTYAVECIRGALCTHMYTYKYPTKVYHYNVALINKINDALKDLSEKNGYTPSCEEISEYLDVPYEKVFKHISLMKKQVYIDDVGYNALDENAVYEYNELDRLEFSSEDIEVLLDLLHFNEVYKGVLKEYLIMKNTTLVAGNVYLSRSRVGQILKNIERNIIKFQGLLLMDAIDTSNYTDEQMHVVDFLKSLKYNENEADYKKIRTI